MNIFVAIITSLTPFLVSEVTNILHQIQELDTELFLALNNQHSPFFDTLMYWTTQRDTWIPLYLLIVFWLIRTYKKQSLYMILAIVLTIVFADQIASSLLKPFVERLRPCHVLYLQAKIHSITDCGGQYGFASSHAANSFGLAMALWLLVGRQIPSIKCFFVWAFLVAYSRVYVGVHYPLDIFAGAMIGCLSALLSVKLLIYLLHLKKLP